MSTIHPAVMLFILGFLLLLCSVACMSIAANRGRNQSTWALVGLLSGVIGILIALCMPKTRDKEAADGIKSGKLKTCHLCAEAVKIEATRCRYCGSDV